MRDDVWLSQVLERPAFAVDAGDAVFNAAGFYTAKVGVEDVDRVASLGRQGFAVVDVSVSFAADADAVPPIPRPVEVVIADAAQADALVEIAGSCFRYSRFHLDPQIDDALANRVKREWIRSYVEGRRGVELLAAVEDGAPVGFLAVLDSGGDRIIDLVGVAPESQGHGVGSSLVAAFCERHGPQARLLRVGTQIANVPSLRLYGACGFAVSSAAYVLHLHADAS